MEKYIKMEWPEIQFYMDNPGYPEKCGFDSLKNIWYVPELWVVEKELNEEICLV